MPPTTRAVAYLRVSSNKQGSGSGLESQRAAIHTYARHRGIQIVRDVIDRSTAHSRKTFESRVRLQDALHTCLELEVPLIVHRVDRLARRSSDMQAILDRGVQVHSVLEGDDPAKLLAAAAAAEVAAEQITSKTRAGQKKRSTPPVNLTEVDRRRGMNSRKREKERRDQALLQVLLEGPEEQTYQMIADELNARGERTEQGLRWTKRSVERPARLVKQMLPESRMKKNPNYGRF